ncbi:hypothetical protein H8959_012405, partial [Pygathrix nigripes]
MKSGPPQALKGSHLLSPCFVPGGSSSADTDQRRVQGTTTEAGVRFAGDRAADFCPTRAVCKVGPCPCRQLETDPRLRKKTGLDLFSVWSRSAMLAPAGSVLAMLTLGCPRDSIRDS